MSLYTTDPHIPEYGDIPKPVDGKFQTNRYGYEKPVNIDGWAWSITFGRWSALVTFADGWHGYTYPKTF